MIRNFVCLAALASAVWAQAPVLNGKFILAEESSTATSLAILTFDPAGAVAGTEYVQSSGLTMSIAVTGNYTIATDGSGVLTLNTQVVTDDGYAPAVSAVYEFLGAKASGFSLIRRDTAIAAVAEVVPASSATSLSGTFSLADEGTSSSGQKVAQIGLLTMKADGSMRGKLVVKRDAISESKAVEGSYITDGAGFGTLKIATPLAADEDGAVVMQTAPYIFAVSAKGEVIAMRTDNSLLGLLRIEPAQ
ncbi:MAG: hypothetical protein HYX27_20725 [Acidobacteria bacterium]|nr:hypothetical protein [Acidobacteriota bacterium]